VLEAHPSRQESVAAMRVFIFQTNFKQKQRPLFAAHVQINCIWNVAIKLKIFEALSNKHGLYYSGSISVKVRSSTN